MLISSRTRQILEMLLKTDRDLTSAEIADYLHVSARTVYRELSAVEGLLRSQGLELLKKSGSGIRLKGDKEKLELLQRLVSTSQDVEFSPDERQIYILSLLLQYREPVKLFTLAHELKVTLPTIGSDLDQLAVRVERYGVTLVRRRGYGVELSGPEAGMRRTIRQLIKLRMDDSELIASRSERPLHPVDRQIFELAGKEEMADVESALWNWGEHWTGSLSENAYTGLLIRLSIAVRRIREGRPIDQTGTGKSFSGQDLEEATRLAQLVSEKLDVPISREETSYMAELLSAAQAEGISPLPGDDMALAETVRMLVSQMQTLTGAAFTEDRSLRDGLFSHLKAAIERMNDGFRIRNPLLDQIRKDYAGLFGIVREAVNLVFPDLKMPDEEIGFLVMHFGSSLERLKQLGRPVRAVLVCTSGIGSSKLLQSRLEKEFPQLEIVDRASWYEASRIPPHLYDLIVSTIDLPLDRAQYIKVSPLLTMGEADRLRSFIKETTFAPKPDGDHVGGEPVPEQNRFRQLLSLKRTLDEILRLIERFKVTGIREQSRGLRAVLEEACRNEAEAGVLTNPEEVTELLMEREQSGSQMLPGTEMALFHTRSADIKQPSLSLYRLAAPLSVDMDPPSRLSRFLLMLAPRILPQESLEILGEISAMLLDGEMIELLEGGDESAIRSYLTVKLKAFFRTKTESE